MSQGRADRCHTQTICSNFLAVIMKSRTLDSVGLHFLTKGIVLIKKKKFFEMRRALSPTSWLLCWARMTRNYRTGNSKTVLGQITETSLVSSSHSEISPVF